MYIVLLYTALFAGIIPLVVLFVKKRTFVFKEPIAPFVWLTAVAALYELIGTAVLKINVSYWFQLYSLLEFAALFYFFYRLLGYKYVLLYKILAVLFVVFYTASFVFWSNADTDRFVSLAVNNIFLIVFILASGILWFVELFKKMEVLNLWKYPDFYFVSGFLMYYFTTLLLFLFSELIFYSNVYFNDFWLVNIIAMLILRILLTIGVWKMNKS